MSQRDDRRRIAKQDSGGPISILFAKHCRIALPVRIEAIFLPAGPGSFMLCVRDIPIWAALLSDNPKIQA